MTSLGFSLRPNGEPGPDIGPPGSRRRWVLVMAAFTTMVEILSVAGLLPPIRIGGLGLSLSLIPALGMAVACGDRLLGRSTFRRVAVGYWIAASLALVGLGVLFAAEGRPDLWMALVAAALGEELVYRLAVPAVIAVALGYGGVRADRARVAGLAMAGVWFVLLPGHQEQMSSAAGAIPFIAFATLAAVLVHHSGSVLPMAMGHAVVNLCTVLVWEDALPTDARGMVLAAVLGLLVLAYGRPRRLTIDDRRGVIDTVTGLEVAGYATGTDGADHFDEAILSDGTEIRLDSSSGNPGPLPHPLASGEKFSQ